MKYPTQFVPLKIAPEFRTESSSGSKSGERLELPSCGIYAMMPASAQSLVIPRVDGIRIVSKVAMVQLPKSFSTKNARRADSFAMYLGTVRTDFTEF